jgi:hypothetical protein
MPVAYRSVGGWTAAGVETLPHDDCTRPNSESARVGLRVGKVAILLGSCWLLLVSSYIENTVWEHCLDRNENKKHLKVCKSLKPHVISQTVA